MTSPNLDLRHLAALVLLAATPAMAASTGAAPASASGSSAANREATRAALSAPNVGQLRPKGPITVTADHAELIEGNDAVYTGDVKVRSDTLQMDGDRLNLRQLKDGQFVAHVTGDPAHLLHAGNGAGDPPMTAHAKSITYDSDAQTLKLETDAKLTRGGNVVTGSTIRYDLAAQRVQAAGGKGAQVKMVIQPPPAAPGAGGGKSAAPQAGGAH